MPQRRAQEWCSLDLPSKENEEILLHYYEVRNVIHDRLMINHSSINHLLVKNIQISKPYNRKYVQCDQRVMLQNRSFV
jgi:hypothetical protein